MSFFCREHTTVIAFALFMFKNYFVLKRMIWLFLGTIHDHWNWTPQSFYCAEYSWLGLVCVLADPGTPLRGVWAAWCPTAAVMQQIFGSPWKWSHGRRSSQETFMKCVPVTPWCLLRPRPLPIRPIRSLWKADARAVITPVPCARSCPAWSVYWSDLFKMLMRMYKIQYCFIH